MSLLELAGTVFRRGCGIHLQTALSSPEYQKLCLEARDLGLSNPDDSALVQLLGTHLARRALQNVPVTIRAQLHKWHEGLTGQHELLELICAELTTCKWREARERTYDYNSDARCVLPAETGTWEDGDVQPNCLGTAHMLHGIADSLGANFFMANTLRANQDTLHAWKIRMLRALAGTLRHRPGVEEFVEKIDEAHVRALEAANVHHQAHHILIIQTEDGTWWAVDPYLSALYALAPSESRDANLAMVAAKRNTLLTATNPTPLIREAVAYMDTRIVIIDFMCALIEARYFTADAPDSPIDLLMYMAAKAMLHEGRVDDYAEFRRSLAFLHYKAVIENDGDMHAMAQYALVYAAHEIEDFDELSDRIEEEKEATKAHMDECLKRIETDRAYEQHIAVRLVRFVLKRMLGHTDELAQRQEARCHEALEIGWAPTVLGIATLNHMQYEDLGQRPSLRGYLAELLKSQWAIYDALVIADQKGEPINPERLNMFWGHLAKFDPMPDLIIAPLVFLLQGRRTNG